MDADVLRIILIVLGAFFILGVYLWERHKRIDGRVQAIRRSQEEQHFEPMGRSDSGDSMPLATDTGVADEEMEQALHELGDLVGGKPDGTPEKMPQPKPKRKGRHLDPAETRQQDLFADDAVVDEDHFKGADTSLPSLILQILIVSPKGSFAGPDILDATESAGMALGDMDIFHRHSGVNGKGAVLYSMASMVNPGVFPVGAMEGFKTPGLAMFTQLPGPQDGLVIFSDMLSTAESLAADLGGELQDETHSRLTKQTVEHIRSQILEHRRKVQLAKSKFK